MTELVCKLFLCKKVIPSIMAKWPRSWDHDGNLEPETIILQQDNALVHVSSYKLSKIMQEFRTNSVRIFAGYQPPILPDLKVLDLALFRSMQTYYFKNPGLNINKLKDKIDKMF